MGHREALCVLESLEGSEIHVKNGSFHISEIISLNLDPWKKIEDELVSAES